MRDHQATGSKLWPYEFWSQLLLIVSTYHYHLQTKSSLLKKCGLVSHQEISPACWLIPSLLEPAIALFKIPAVVVTRVLNKEVVFQHLLANWTRHKALISIRIHLNKPSFLSGNLFELLEDLRSCVVVFGGEYLSTEGLGRILQRCSDVFTWISSAFAFQYTLANGCHIPISFSISTSGNLAFWLTG